MKDEGRVGHDQRGYYGEGREHNQWKITTPNDEWSSSPGHGRARNRSSVKDGLEPYRVNIGIDDNVITSSDASTMTWSI
jgi:hypothetical protein